MASPIFARYVLTVAARAYVLAALASFAGAQSFPARVFAQEDGLENLSVTALAQQREGHLWVATQNGLFRYDGSRFREFGRTDGFNTASIFSLLVDDSGTVWAGTHAGLFHFDGNKFREVQYKGHSVRVGMNSSLTATSRGEVIAATTDGIVSITNTGKDWSILPYRERHAAFPKSDDTNGVLADPGGPLWFGCGEAICSFSGSATRRFGPEEGSPGDYYVAFFRAQDGRLWARGRKHILTWTPSDARMREVTSTFPAGGLATLYRRFGEDTFGNVLAPTAAGFATWDGKLWTETAATSRGAIGGATALLTDAEGAVWIGTRAYGLLQSLGYRRWANYGTPEGLSNVNVFAIAADRAGHIWTGNETGVEVLERGTNSFAPSPLAKEKDVSAIESLSATADGGMWVAGFLGKIYHVDRRGRVDHRASFDGYIKRIRVDASGTLWIGSGIGLFTVSCQGKVDCEVRPVPVFAARTSVKDMQFDPGGSLWIAGARGLDRMTGGALTHIAIPGHAEPLNLVTVARDGTVWLSGQNGGVVRIRVDGGDAKVLGSYARPQIASDFVESLDADARGRIWVGTDHGFNVIEDGKIYRVTEDDGLIGNDADDKAFFADPDGSVWLGTSRGISHLLDPPAALQRPPFTAAIDGVFYDDAELQPGASILWKGGATVFRYSGLTFRNNKSLIYHYRLDGFDPKEIATRTPFARFQNLPPGTYTMRVTAEDPMHGIFSAPVERSVILVPPWWRSKAFYGLLAMAALGAIAGLWRLSHVALLAQRKKLQRLVAERTLELEKMAVTDGLTGLMNRKAIMAALAAESDCARGHGTAVCIAMVDLDHFKRINDTLGHLAGDEVLRQAAERLSNAIRSTDLAGRYGGEEFMVIFKDVKTEFALERCEAIRAALCKAPIVYGEHSLTITCSIGMAWGEVDADPLVGLVAQADGALYAAKANGRNRVEFAKAARLREEPVSV